jgi:hypothetical protein
MQLRLVFITLIPILALAQDPRLCPRIVLPGDGVGETFWLFAPQIAVVRILRAEWTGPEIEITPPQKVVVRLVSVDAIVENVVRGDLKEGSSRFYFFANTLSANGYHTVLGWLAPGERYLVFLREDGNVLRTQADVSGFSIRIRSGFHDLVPGPRMGSPVAPGLAITRIALTPSPDFEKGFAANVQHTYGEIAQFAPPYETARLLRQLLKHEDPDVRAQACLTLSSNYRYRDPCLPELLRSANEGVRQQAARWLKMQPSSQSLLRSLIDDPLSLSKSGRVDDLSGDLELFAIDLDPAVRKQACDTLHTLLPLRRFSACATPEGAK